MPDEATVPPEEAEESPVTVLAEVPPVAVPFAELSALPDGVREPLGAAVTPIEGATVPFEDPVLGKGGGRPALPDPVGPVVGKPAAVLFGKLVPGDIDAPLEIEREPLAGAVP